jgi:hypothetical protein
MTLYATVEAYGAFPQPPENCPVSELDPYSDEALIDPWAVYGELQRLGSAVWLNKYRGFTLLNANWAAKVAVAYARRSAYEGIERRGREKSERRTTGRYVSAFRGRCEAESRGHVHEVGERASFHFAHHLASVSLHRDLADAELEPDLFIQQAADNQRHDLLLATTE